MALSQRRNARGGLLQIMSKASIACRCMSLVIFYGFSEERIRSWIYYFRIDLVVDNDRFPDDKNYVHKYIC